MNPLLLYTGKERRRNKGYTYDEILDMMLENGVDSMPGGGAEIFDEKVRDYILSLIHI